MGTFKEFLKLGGIIGGLAMLALAAGPAHAGSTCSDKGVRAFGDIGGGPFNVPADTRSLTGPSEKFVALSSEDCDRCDDAKRDARRSAGVAAAMDAYAAQPGLNLTLNYANIGLEDDVHAVGGVATYKHHLADPGVFHSITGKLGFGTATTGDEMVVSAGMSFNFGTF